MISDEEQRDDINKQQSCDDITIYHVYMFS